MQDKELEKAIRELAKREHEFVQAATELPTKKHAYKLKFAVTIRKVEGTVQEKESLAVEICEKEYSELLIAEARAEIAKTLLTDCREVLQARRSLLSNEKSEREFSGSGLQT